MRESQRVRELRDRLRRWLLATLLMVLDMFVLISVARSFSPMPQILLGPIMGAFEFCYIIAHVTFLVANVYLLRYMWAKLTSMR